MSEKNIKISSDFHCDPFGRYPSDGDYSGELFRKKLLIPALKEYDLVKVDVDDLPDDVGSSFFEEIFGGVVREGLSDLLPKLEVVSQSEFLKLSIHRYIDKALADN